jgi:alkane 1-monooxygenase
MNCAVLSVLAAVIFSGLIWRVYGTQAFVLYMVTAFGAIAYLEAINYIEHYGLRREKKDNGEYEKVSIKHSWNSPHRISNYLLFKLQRHSDHHENSLKPYQTLESLEDSPQLSHGYSLTIIMALFPSVWFAVMDPLVDEYSKLKTGMIDSEVRAKANKLIRMFIIEISLASVVLCVANHFILSMGEVYQSSQSFSL